MENIHYDQVEKLGFKREAYSDNVFYKMHGYECFLMQLKIKNIVFDWESTTMKVEMIRYKKQNRMCTVKIQTIDELKFFIEFFSSDDNKQLEMLKSDIN